MLLLERKADLTPFSNSLIESCSIILEAGFFMFWFAIMHIFSAILELIHNGRLYAKGKDLKIKILHHQLANFFVNASYGKDTVRFINAPPLSNDTKPHSLTYS